jgi:hypothetical protein
VNRLISTAVRSLLLAAHHPEKASAAPATAAPNVDGSLRRCSGTTISP